VGRPFAEVTGYTPQSLTAWLGIYYYDMPDSVEPNLDKDELLIPQESMCHIRGHLHNWRNQIKIRPKTMYKLERKRTDIWYLLPDGSNIEDSIEDIIQALVNKGLPFYRKYSGIREKLITKKPWLKPNGIINL
jgi:hypothetical protein